MKRIAIIVFAILISSIGFSQQKKYVSYTVKQGETMKKIAKIHKISTKDLLRLNPDVSRKPKVNTVIIVPNLDFEKKTEAIKSSIAEGGFYFVKRKETWFGIAKKFNISVEELKVANLTVADLKVGTKLTIPKVKKVVEEDLSRYQLHTVVKDDTVFNLTKRFNVSEDDLLSLNPELKEGLKLGMILKIKPIAQVAEIVDSTMISEDSKKMFVENFDTSKSLNVVLMLPYELQKNRDSILDKNLKKSNSLINIATDFHMGAKIAVDSLKQKGVNVHLEYFDTENSTKKIQYVLNTNSFSNTDVVIGPLFYDKAVWLSKKIDAPVVAPIYSKKQDKISSNTIVKSAPNTKLLSEALLKYLEENYKGENIVLINDGGTATQTSLWQTVNKLKTFDSIQTISVIKPSPGKDKKKNLVINNEKLIEKLSLTSNNWIILITDEIETTASAINGLKSYESEEFNLSLFSLGKGRNFDKIDNNLLGDLNFTYATSEFLDTNNPLVKRFYTKYQKINHAVPSKYAVRGFDVTYDILARLASVENALDSGISTRVSSSFDYSKKLFGATENREVRIIKYNNELIPIVIE